MFSFWIITTILIATALILVLLPLYRQPKTKSLFILLAMIIPTTTIGLYYYFGASQEWQTYQQRQQLVDDLNDPNQVITRLQARIQQQPDDAQAWFWLGRVYLGQERYQLAADSLQQAYELQPDDSAIALNYVQADFLANNNQLSSSNTIILEAVIDEQPDNLQALNILALASYEQKNYQKAITIWQQMLEHYSEQSSEYQVINLLIAEAQQQ